MVAKNIKVLKEVGLLKNFRNSFLSLFFHFLYHFFSMHFINFMSLPVSWDGGGGGGRGERGRKGGRSTRMRLAGGHCFVLTSLVSCSQPAISGSFSLINFSFYFVYFLLSKDQGEIY